MVRAFISYSHKDEALRNELESHLAMLKRSGTVETWHDRRIVAGTEIDSAISTQLEAAQIILLLVSSDFLASNYCYDIEMKRALEKHQEGSCCVIPVILRPCDWHASPFGKLAATPPDGVAVTKFPNQDEAFTTIVREIRRAAQQFAAPQQPSGQVETMLLVDAKETAQDEPRRHMGAERSSNLRVARHFNDHDRDDFLENVYEYMARFFEKSLGELQERNPQISTKFKRIDANSFTASIYANGERVSVCSIMSGSTGAFGRNSIRYSSSGEAPRNSWNEQLTVADDGYTLHLQAGFTQSENERLTDEGASEFYWGMLMYPLQRKP